MSHSRTAGRDGSRSRRRLPAALLTGLLAAGALAGCGPAPELGRGAASQLQTLVLAVSQAAATNDRAGALKHLDELLTRLDAAAASGEVSFRRHQSIKASIDAVRADLVAQQAAAEAARKTAETAAAKQAAAAQATAQAAAAAKAAPPAVAPAPAPAANDTKGKPKDKGKGKG